MDDKILIDLINDNKKLIYSIIYKYGRNFSFEDLEQVSIIGIIKAYHNYDSKMGVKFSTYAYKYILSEILQYINDSKFIKTSREYIRLGKKIIEARNILSQRLMKEPSNEDIALLLDIDIALIDDVLKYQDRVRSLDEVIIEDSNKITLMDKISIEKDQYNENLLDLKNAIKALSLEDQQLIRMRYFNDKTQSEIAKFLGTNQVQVSRKEQKVLKRIKNNLCGTL